MQPIWTSVCVPIMRSYAGGSPDCGISTISGLIVTYLDSENSGNENSRLFPTFTVSKVPQEVRHFWGEIRLFVGTLSVVFLRTNRMSPSEPLSNRTRYGRCDLLFLLQNCGRATIELTIPLPITILDCNMFISSVMTLIGLASSKYWIFEIPFRSELLISSLFLFLATWPSKWLLSLTLRSSDPTP